MFLHQNIIPRIFLRGKKAYSHLDSSIFFQFSLHFYIKIIMYYINKMTLCAVMALVTWWVYDHSRDLYMVATWSLHDQPSE